MSSNKLVAVAIQDDLGLDAQVSQYPVYCPAYVLVEIDDHGIVDSLTLPNPHFEDRRPSLMPPLIHDFGAQVFIAGEVKRRASRLFSKLGIEVAIGSGDARGAILDYIRQSAKSVPQGRRRRRLVVTGNAPASRQEATSTVRHAPEARRRQAV